MATEVNAAIDATPAIEETWGTALAPAFGGCALPKLSLDGRLVYSTDRMEGVLCARGWHPEDARLRVARLSRVTRAGWPDFLDWECNLHPSLSATRRPLSFQNTLNSLNSLFLKLWYESER